MKYQIINRKRTSFIIHSVKLICPPWIIGKARRGVGGGHYSFKVNERLLAPRTTDWIAIREMALIISPNCHSAVTVTATWVEWATNCLIRLLKDLYFLRPYMFGGNVYFSILSLLSLLLRNTISLYNSSCENFDLSFHYFHSRNEENGHPNRWNNMHHFSKVASLSRGNFSTP